MKRAWIVVLLLAGTVGAQSANVIELSPADTERAQKAWNALQKAKNQWAEVVAQTNMRYAISDKPCVEGQRNITVACVATPMPGFENGFEFSKDFKYIVPKPPEQKQQLQFGFQPAMGGLTMKCNETGSVCY